MKYALALSLLFLSASAFARRNGPVNFNEGYWRSGRSGGGAISADAGSWDTSAASYRLAAEKPGYARGIDPSVAEARDVVGDPAGFCDGRDVTADGRAIDMDHTIDTHPEYGVATLEEFLRPARRGDMAGIYSSLFGLMYTHAKGVARGDSGFTAGLVQANSLPDGDDFYAEERMSVQDVVVSVSNGDASWTCRRVPSKAYYWNKAGSVQVANEWVSVMTRLGPQDQVSMRSYKSVRCELKGDLSKLGPVLFQVMKEVKAKFPRYNDGTRMRPSISKFKGDGFVLAGDMMCGVVLICKDGNCDLFHQKMKADITKAVSIENWPVVKERYP